MRIRKRFHNLTSTPPDLSSPSPPSMAAAASVLTVSGVAGGKHGEDNTAAAAAAAGGGSGGGGGRWLHPNGDLPGEPFHRCTPKPSSPCFRPSRPEAATAEGEERRDRPSPPGQYCMPDGDVLPNHGAGGGQVAKRKLQDGGANGGGYGDAAAHWRRNADAPSTGAIAVAPKSLGAEIAAEARPLGHGGHEPFSNSIKPAEPAAKVEDMARSWPSDVAQKRRGLYNRAGSKAEEEDTVVGLETEVQVNPKPAGNTRRRRTTGGSGTRIVGGAGAAGRAAALITSAGSTDGSVAAPAAAGAVRAASKCDNNVSAPVKEEDVQAAAAAEGNRGVAGINGKKSRRSPAVLMEGSRCSRVNGRGWRCCQQTLVGYSLCEHHLGKGRLRSVSSVVRPNGGGRRKEEATDGAAAPPSLQPSAPILMQQKRQARQLLLSSGDVDGDYVVEEEEEEENPGNKRRRTKKIGMVKARSISSLLQYQPNYTASTPAAEQYSAPSLAPADTGNNYSGSCTS